MSSPVATLPADATVGEARVELAGGLHTAYPLVDATGGCVGIVTRTDLLDGRLPDDELVRGEASVDLATVSPTDLAIAAFQRMTEEAVDHIPVVDGDRLVGIVTRTDLLRASSRRFEHERPQPGWRPARRQPA